MPTWVAVLLVVSSAVVAVGSIFKLLIKPLAELIVLQQKVLPLLRDLSDVFAHTPKPFDVLGEIVNEFRNNGGSTLRDVVDGLADAAEKNSSAAEILKVEVEASRQLAVHDREQLTRLMILIDRLTVKVDAGDMQRTRMEVATVQVAADLEQSHQRADAVSPGSPGEASDAASRSPEQ